MWFSTPPEGKSVTLTFFAIGFIVALTKLLLSDMVVGGLHMGPFSGTDFAAVTGALGAIYAARKHSDNTTQKEE